MKHIHRYEKRVIGRKGYTVFVCNLDGCNHYIAQSLAKGKKSLCNRCGNEMKLDRRAMRLVKPHCVDCIKTKKSDSHDKLLQFIEAHDEGMKE